MDHKKELLDRLNNQYQDILRQKLSIFVTYSTMVKNCPYTVMASFTYDKEDRPQRSTRIAASDSNSDDGRSPWLPLPFQNLSAVGEHDEFFQLIINARTVAQLNKAPEKITWRGYVTHIPPDFELTRESLRNELLTSLKVLTELSDMEKKVTLLFYFTSRRNFSHL